MEGGLQAFPVLGVQSGKVSALQGLDLLDVLQSLYFLFKGFQTFFNSHCKNLFSILLVYQMVSATA